MRSGMAVVGAEGRVVRQESRVVHADQAVLVAQAVLAVLRHHRQARTHCLHLLHFFPIWLSLEEASDSSADIFVRFWKQLSRFVLVYHYLENSKGCHARSCDLSLMRLVQKSR